MSESRRERHTAGSSPCQPPSELTDGSCHCRGEEAVIAAAGSGVLGAPRCFGFLDTSPHRYSSLSGQEVASGEGERRGSKRDEVAGGEEGHGAG
jgi:hypothetical protein